MQHSLSSMLVLLCYLSLVFTMIDVTKHPNWSLLEHNSCGNSNSDRIIGGKNASLGAYPWIARIGYSMPDAGETLSYRCGGTIISKLYVVTAAHCVADLPENFKVNGIRLGEHNTLTDPDCEKGFCAEPVQDFLPESIIIHEDYNNPMYKNDIAIVRLNKPAVYNEHVKPICMMSGDLLRKNYLGETAEVAGWGIYDINDPKPSIILQTVKLPVVEMDRCVIAFKSYADVSGKQQMCVGGIPGEDSCGGDSGGPLMKVESLDGPPKYYLIGIVSFVRVGKVCCDHLLITHNLLIITNLNNPLRMSTSTFLVFLNSLTLLIINIHAQSRTDCTADNQVGTCISARDCTLVSNILQQSREQAIDYLRRNHCGFEGSNPMVCCINNASIHTRPGGLVSNPGTTQNWNPETTTSESAENTQIDLASNPLLPSDCGRDLSQKLLGGERTEPSEFPWMALLEYQKPNGRTTACGGVLINKRYVLTAAHCIKGKDLPTNWRLTSVRLGEYNTDTEQDCVPNGDNTELCIDDPVTVGVEEQFAHEEYRPLSRDQRYDIALLRLSRDVTFTTYIKPICLPSNPSLSGKLFVAGWGKTENRSASNIKLKLGLPLADKSQCDQTYTNAGVQLGFGQLCAGGQKGKDSCRGDSGGPLMAVERLTDGALRWTSVGVVSFGPSPCGMQGWPGVYTKVIDFVPWILSKLRNMWAMAKQRITDDSLLTIVPTEPTDLIGPASAKERERIQKRERRIATKQLQEIDWRGVITLVPQINMMFIGTLVLFLVLTTIDAQGRCSEGSGNCINIRNCPAIISILRGSRPLSAEALQTLRNSQCGFEGSDPKVCCDQGTTTTTTTTTTTEGPEIIPSPPDVSNHPNLRLLEHVICGPIVQQKVVGGNKTGVFQYPWMALIAYDTGRPNPEFRCGGTVISSRYILTAAHCVTTLPAGLRVIGARIGDHDINTERDCERDMNGLEGSCAERYQDFGVDSIHFHPDYTRTKLQNDIALIRLNNSVDFRPRNARPICLPFGTSAPLTQKIGVVTGWGATELGPRSQALLQAKLPLVSYEQCKETYKRTTQIWYKQLCAGGQMNVDSCLGDSGGPLQAGGIYNSRSVRIIQYGVVSYGLKQCGTEGFPGVYTKVAYYMDWILNTMTD
ncbi:PREDICTED: uncharacterized protein LOC105565840 [Vollenhovia emeryi]|uniref:uncharacterized protein LOC105565840 n=1 Tax=Vollenhovia emeryi TaxID=411798 RepID=UPI0005F458F7|nr:PREDICTED: uncharacterized protein LOC105565840 [Vollenhovia emeryi]